MRAGAGSTRHTRKGECASGVALDPTPGTAMLQRPRPLHSAGADWRSWRKLERLLTTGDGWGDGVADGVAGQAGA